MSNETITSGSIFSLVSTLSSGTNIEFLNNAGNSGILYIDPAAIIPQTIGSLFGETLVGAAIGGTIENFKPGDEIVIRNIDQVFSNLNVNPLNAVDDAIFDVAVQNIALFNQAIYVAADGAVTSSDPLFHIDSNTTRILDDLQTALFGAGSDAPITISTVSEGFFEPYDAVISSDHAINTCFTPGTRILTTRGEVKVEDLALGDVAVLHDGADAPIIFIGRRDLDLARHPRPEAVRPVRIRAGALGQGNPARDLVISPDHALYLDGVLVQAKDLIDGITITQDWAVKAVRYYHVELPSHCILLAEGTPAESYLDTGHRGLFDNGGQVVILHPDMMQMRRETESAAPLCTNGELLTALRARLHMRKFELGCGLEEARNIRLRVGGCEINPVRGEWGRFDFDLTGASGAAVLDSQVFVPAEIDPCSNDRRVLGIAIAYIALDGVEMPVESVIMAADLHEGGADPARWTRGRARLQIPAGASSLSLVVAGYPCVWQRAA